MIMLLLEKERVGVQELADLFEVSPRTICHHIDAINMAEIPVRSTTLKWFLDTLSPHRTESQEHWTWDW